MTSINSNLNDSYDSDGYDWHDLADMIQNNENDKYKKVLEENPLLLNDSSLLGVAIFNENEDLVSYLLEKECNLREYQGETYHWPITDAIKCKNVNCVREILKRGGGIDVEYCGGIQKDHKLDHEDDYFKNINKHGFSKKTKRIRWQFLTIFQLAILKVGIDYDFTIPKMMLDEFGLDINEVIGDGPTALDVARRVNDDRLVEFLLPLGAISTYQIKIKFDEPDISWLFCEF
jgi:hypothetical protein